jgi:hypothetical protein
MPHFRKHLPEAPQSGLQTHPASFAAAVEVRRAGVLVAVPDADTGREMIGALQAAGFAALSARTGNEVADMLSRSFAPDADELPEVWVIDVTMLDADREHLLDALEEAGCIENVIVILSGLWPRGLCPTWLDRVVCLHEPLPMPVFVEEVARLASPASMRTERLQSA